MVAGADVEDSVFPNCKVYALLYSPDIDFAVHLSGSSLTMLRAMIQSYEVVSWVEQNLGGVGSNVGAALWSKSLVAVMYCCHCNDHGATDTYEYGFRF